MHLGRAAMAHWKVRKKGALETVSGSSLGQAGAAHCCPGCKPHGDLEYRKHTGKKAWACSQKEERLGAIFPKEHLLTLCLCVTFR